MAKMTKAQSRKRLKEALQKVQAVYMAGFLADKGSNVAVSTADMTAIEKIISKCLNRIK
jgi:hypothetical protein